MYKNYYCKSKQHLWYKTISRKINFNFNCKLINDKPIPIHGNGRNVRYYLSALDFAKALIVIINKKDRGTYNIGSNYYEKT